MKLIPSEKILQMAKEAWNEYGKNIYGRDIIDSRYRPLDATDEDIFLEAFFAGFGKAFDTQDDYGQKLYINNDNPMFECANCEKKSTDHTEFVIVDEGESNLCCKECEESEGK